jgi:hypothetical protein
VALNSNDKSWRLPMRHLAKGKPGLATDPWLRISSTSKCVGDKDIWESRTPLDRFGAQFLHIQYNITGIRDTTAVLKLAGVA